MPPDLPVLPEAAVTDPTGPELLDALERLIENVRRDAESDDGIDESTLRALLAVEYGAIKRLRSLLRTPEETAVLRAAISWLGAFVDEDVTVGLVGAAEDLVRALDSLPPERCAELMKEDKTDG
jgi:hypothetical protein